MAAFATHDKFLGRNKSSDNEEFNIKCTWLNRDVFLMYKIK